MLRSRPNSTTPLSILIAHESLAHKMEALVCFTGSGYESSPNPPALRATSCSYIPSHDGATHRAELRCLTSTPGVGTWGNGS